MKQIITSQSALEACEDCQARFPQTGESVKLRDGSSLRCEIGEDGHSVYTLTPTDHKRIARNAARRFQNEMLRELCGTSARAAREDMGL